MFNDLTFHSVALQVVSQSSEFEWVRAIAVMRVWALAFHWKTNS
jgi:hypothetical protein